MKSKQQEQSNNNNLVSEPSMVYGKRSITTFTSFEEMENDQLKYFESLTPEQSLMEHKKLSMAAFGIRDNNVKPINTDRTIKFNDEP